MMTPDEMDTRESNEDLFRAIYSALKQADAKMVLASAGELEPLTDADLVAMTRDRIERMS